jgi:hypothetical protein
LGKIDDHDPAASVKQQPGVLVPGPSVPPGAGRERLAGPNALPSPGPKAQTTPNKSLEGPPPGSPRKRVGLIKAHKLAGRVQAHADQGSAAGRVLPDAMQDKEQALAAIKKLFRKMDLPGSLAAESDSLEASTQGYVGQADFHELGARVGERLDAVFRGERVLPDAPLNEKTGSIGKNGSSSRTRAFSKKPSAGTHPANGQLELEALASLRAIMGELKIGPVHTLEAFARELERLKPAFAEKRRVLALIELQARLCRHLAARSGSMHEQAVVTLLKAFNAMDSLATDRGLSDSDERVLVEQVLHEFKSFKSSLSEKSTGRKGPTPAKRPDFALAAEPFEKLMDFLRGEFSDLENLLRSQLRPRKGRPERTPMPRPAAGGPDNKGQHHR